MAYGTLKFVYICQIPGDSVSRSLVISSKKYQKRLRRHRCTQGCQLFHGAGAGASHHRLLGKRKNHAAAVPEFSGDPGRGGDLGKRKAADGGEPV